VISRISDAMAVKRMKIGQYCLRQRCRHVELEQFWQAFASRGFVSDSWAFLYSHFSELISVQEATCGGTGVVNETDVEASSVEKFFFLILLFRQILQKMLMALPPWHMLQFF